MADADVLPWLRIMEEFGFAIVQNADPVLQLLKKSVFGIFIAWILVATVGHTTQFYAVAAGLLIFLAVSRLRCPGMKALSVVIMIATLYIFSAQSHPRPEFNDSYFYSVLCYGLFVSTLCFRMQYSITDSLCGSSWFQAMRIVAILCQIILHLGFQIDYEYLVIPIILNACFAFLTAATQYGHPEEKMSACAIVGILTLLCVLKAKTDVGFDKQLPDQVQIDCLLQLSGMVIDFIMIQGYGLEPVQVSWLERLPLILGVILVCAGPLTPSFTKTGMKVMSRIKLARNITLYIRTH